VATFLGHPVVFLQYGGGNYCRQMTSLSAYTVTKTVSNSALQSW